MNRVFLRLKEGGAYYKVRNIFQMKFENFVYFSQININDYHYIIVS